MEWLAPKGIDLMEAMALGILYLRFFLDQSVDTDMIVYFCSYTCIAQTAQSTVAISSREHQYII